MILGPSAEYQDQGEEEGGIERITDPLNPYPFNPFNSPLPNPPPKILLDSPSIRLTDLV